MSPGPIITSNSIPNPLLSGSEHIEFIEVQERIGQTTHFTIRYRADLENGDFPRANNLMLGPGAVLGILAPSGLSPAPDCLVQGPVWSQKIHMEHGGEGSWMDVRGADTSIVMDREFKSMVWSNVTDSEAVTVILGTYGLIPNVMPTVTRHLEIKQNLVQRSSDLQFVRKLARRNGCRFWITCNEVGIEIGHFQRIPMPGPPATLLINMPGNNIDSFDIEWDVERPTTIQGVQLDLSTKVLLPGVVVKPLQPPLGPLDLITITLPGMRSNHLAAPVADVADLLARNEGALAEANWFIRAKCQTSVHRLGQIVRANTIVNVLGAGIKHSGPYLVAGVNHKIDASSHIMELDLLRNGWQPAA